jgi:hypothetical protein
LSGSNVAFVPGEPLAESAGADLGLFALLSLFCNSEERGAQFGGATGSINNLAYAILIVTAERGPPCIDSFSWLWTGSAQPSQQSGSRTICDQPL